jgi:hypothetical protein
MPHGIALLHGIAIAGVKRLARERGHEDGAAKTCCYGRSFARFQESGADALPCPVGRDEKCTDPRGIYRGVQPTFIRDLMAIAAKHCGAATPAPARDNLFPVHRDEIRPVANDLAIHAEDGSQRSGHLRRGIVRGLQGKHRPRNQRLNFRRMGQSRGLQRPSRLHGKGASVGEFLEFAPEKDAAKMITATARHAHATVGSSHPMRSKPASNVRETPPE